MSSSLVQHPELVEYLRLSGWAPQGRWRGVASVFEHEGTERSGGQPVTVEVVTDPDLADYRRRNDEVVRLLADFEGMTVDQMVEAIASPSADRLSFTISSEMMAAGSIPLEDSIRLRQAQKGILLAAAHSALEARDHFPRMTRTEAVELIASVREGQTARGSYISRLFIPVLRPLGQLELEGEPPPYARRVTSTLLRALHQISNAVETGRPETLLDTANEGVSANLLSALAELRPPGATSALSVSVQWSGGWDAPKDIPNRVRFATGEFETFPLLAKRLRDRQESAQYSVLGYIVSLEREEAADSEGPGHVVVLAPREDVPGRNMRVRIFLDGPEYQKAIQAHREAHRIQVVGTLKKVGRRWSLESPSPIVIARDDDDDV